MIIGHDENRDGHSLLAKGISIQISRFSLKKVTQVIPQEFLFMTPGSM